MAVGDDIAGCTAHKTRIFLDSTRCNKKANHSIGFFIDLQFTGKYLPVRMSQQHFRKGAG